MVSNTAFGYMILALCVMFLICVGLIILVFATGIGRKLWQRFKQRILYKRGNHINTIFVRNNHVASELFLKKESDGGFKINEKPYTTNPLTTFIFEGIPTQLSHEGIAEPHNIFNDKLADLMSTAELDRIIMAAQNPHILEELKKWRLIFIIFVFMVGIFVIVSVYFNWKIYDAIAQKHLLDLLVSIGQNATQVQPR